MILRTLVISDDNGIWKTFRTSVDRRHSQIYEIQQMQRNIAGNQNEESAQGSGVSRLQVELEEGSWEARYMLSRKACRDIHQRMLLAQMPPLFAIHAQTQCGLLGSEIRTQRREGC